MRQRIFCTDYITQIFQSTHPRRMRHLLLLYYKYRLIISIHASKKDATLLHRLSISNHIDFNPRIQEGCDSICCHPNFSTFRFQSTHPRRMRQLTIPLITSLAVFQSTHPRRMRPVIGNGLMVGSIISIHASKKDATSCLTFTSFSISYFNPRIQEGCD